MDIKTEKFIQNLDERSQITIKLTGIPEEPVSMLRNTTSGIVPPVFGIVGHAKL